MEFQLPPAHTTSSSSTLFSTSVLLPPPNLDSPLLCGSSTRLLNSNCGSAKSVLAQLHTWAKLCVPGLFTSHLAQLWWDRHTQTLYQATKLGC